MLKSVSKKSILGSLVVMGLLWALPSQSQVTMGEPDYDGSGCPFGSASITLSPDNKVLSVLFDSFLVEVGQGISGQSLDCQMKVPFHIPEGYQVSLVKIDYRGYSLIPRLGKMRVLSQYSFTYPGQGQTTKTFSKQNTRLGPIDEDFFISVRMNKRLLWSTCGEDVELNLNAEIEAQTNRWDEEGLLTLDSLDQTVESKTEYYLNWRKCVDNPRRPSRIPPNRDPGRRGGRYCPRRNC